MRRENREGENLERVSTSLYVFWRLAQQTPARQEAKLVYAARATRGHRFCGVSTTPGGRGFLLLGLFFG